MSGAVLPKFVFNIKGMMMAHEENVCAKYHFEFFRSHTSVEFNKKLTEGGFVKVDVYITLCTSRPLFQCLIEK